MTHLMIDLETMGLGAGAPILQIGWALFDLPGNSCRSNVIHTMPGKKILVQFDTLMWWLAQDDAARRAITQVPVKDRVPMERALRQLSDLVFEERIEGVWSHGATFDIPMLEHMYDEHDIKIPWGYRTTRDTRTILWLAGMSRDDIKSTVKHSAEADAIAQALAVQEAYTRIKTHGV